jgi:hypothetical protein
MRNLRISTLTVMILIAFAGTGAQCTDDGQRIDEQNEAAEIGQSGRDERIGERDVFDLRPGDCLTWRALSASELSSAEVVPCVSSRAAGRITNMFLVERASGPYPGEAYFENQWLLGCDLAATTGMFPTVESWNAGDRTITCIEEFY